MPLYSKEFAEKQRAIDISVQPMNGSRNGPYAAIDFDLAQPLSVNTYGRGVAS